MCKKVTKLTLISITSTGFMYPLTMANAAFPIVLETILNKYMLVFVEADNI